MSWWPQKNIFGFLNVISDLREFLQNSPQNISGVSGANSIAAQSNTIEVNGDISSDVIKQQKKHNTQTHDGVSECG